MANYKQLPLNAAQPETITAQPCRVLLVATMMSPFVLFAGCHATATDSEVAFKEGKEAQTNRQFDLALRFFNDAIRLNPKYAEAYRFRGLTYEAKHDYEKAFADYSQAIVIAPNDYQAYYLRGAIFDGFKGESDNAIKDYTSAITANPDDGNAYFLRGLIFKERGEYDTAIADVTEALRCNHECKVAYMIRGGLYQQIGDKVKADADFRAYRPASSN